MSSLFGAHLLTPLDQGAVQSAERAKVPAYKTMASDLAPIETFLARKPDGLVILRHYFELSEQEQYRREGDYGAETVVRRIASNFAAIIAHCRERGVPVFAEGLNEPNPNPWDDLPNLATWYIHFAAHCESLGLRPLAYSWGTGNPPTYGWGAQNPQFATYEESNLAMWRVLYPGLKACHDAGGGGAWHAYDWPGWLTDPYWQGLRVFNDLEALDQIDPAMTADLLVAITEASIDVGIKPEYVAEFGERKGWWTALSGDGTEYARQAGAYERRIRASRWAANIKVVIPFTGGKGGGWADYSTDDLPEYEQLIRNQEEEAMAHKETIVTIDPLPAVHPGEVIHVTGLITGIDGPKGKAQLYARYPEHDPSADWGQTGLTIADIVDGPFAIDVTLGPANYPFDTPIMGTLDFKVLELDPSNQSFEMPSFTVPFAILPPESAVNPPNAQPAPNPQPTSNPSEDWQNSPDLPAMTALYNAAHALEGNSFAKVAEIGKRGVQLVDWWKGGPEAADPFAKKSETPKK